MSFYEGLHSELTKDQSREPLLVRLFLGLFSFYERLRRRFRRR